MSPSLYPVSPDDPPPAEVGSWLITFGSVVGAGTVGSTFATAPALLRLESVAGVCSPIGAWALLTGATLVPMSLLVLALRRARGSFGAFDNGDDWVPFAMLLAWFGSTFVTLALLGALLRAQTHHHALAGVTFAIAGVVLSLVLARIWARLAAITHRAPKGPRWVILVAVGVGLAVSLMWALRGLARESPPLKLENMKLLDGLAFAIGALIASGRPFVNGRALALVGPPLAAVVLVLGASSLRTCPSLREALSGQAPGVSLVVALVGSN
jgi:hypothetical protein